MNKQIMPILLLKQKYDGNKINEHMDIHCQLKKGIDRFE